MWMPAAAQRLHGGDEVVGAGDDRNRHPAGGGVDGGVGPEGLGGTRQVGGIADLHVDDVAADPRLELVGGADRHPTSVVDDGDGVGQSIGFLEVLGGEQHVGARLHQPLDGQPELVAAARVEPGGGLVEEQQLRRADEAGAEVEPTAHAARVRAHESVAGVGEAQLLEDGLRRLAGSLAAVAEEAGHHHQVLPTGHGRLDRGVLPGQADEAPHLGRVGDDVDAGDGQGAGGGLHEGGDGPDEGGLPGAVGAEHSQDLAPFGVEVETVEGVHLAVVFGEADGLDDCVHGPSLFTTVTP